jgi:hypothetical protein
MGQKAFQKQGTREDRRLQRAVEGTEGLIEDRGLLRVIKCRRWGRGP